MELRGVKNINIIKNYSFEQGLLIREVGFVLMGNRLMSIILMKELNMVGLINYFLGLGEFDKFDKFFFC